MYRALLAALAIVLAVVLVAAGFVGGVLVARSASVLPVASGVSSVPGNDQTPGVKPASQNVIDQVESRILQNYAEPPDQKKLERGAIDGMIKSLGDPYTSYFDAQHYRLFREMTTGEFYGVGIQIGVKKNQVTVIAPIDGTPAQRAGIKAGDVIVSVDGSSTKGMNVEIVASKIRGEANTKVTLTIKRPGSSATKDYVLTRVKLAMPNVSGREVTGTAVGYVRVHTFSENVVSDVRKQMSALKAKGAKGFVIDLRDNPGGLLQSGVDMASLFIDRDTIVIIKHRGGKVETLLASGGADVTDPVVVLVNNGSASASEIFAGAMQDRGRAKLVGETTFGKAAVQTILNLPGGGGLKITTAHYLTPAGHNISKKGIKPDYVVKFVLGKNGQPDTQLAKAIEVLKTEMP